ncbi:MAG: hypothetical protein F6K48_26760 [Okeania sp. SIO3H1]|nr:hypothetical protein [Okeania sp. SIO1I7]NEN92307.1 hypothetical protein [Okeania sp. SIO3H1]NET26808.1 hypothetical protein [Okeania sp. SIO1I7]
MALREQGRKKKEERRRKKEEGRKKKEEGKILLCLSLTAQFIIFGFCSDF